MKAPSYDPALSQCRPAIAERVRVREVAARWCDEPRGVGWEQAVDQTSPPSHYVSCENCEACAAVEAVLGGRV